MFSFSLLKIQIVDPVEMLAWMKADVKTRTGKQTQWDPVLTGLNTAVVPPCHHPQNWGWLGVCPVHLDQINAQTFIECAQKTTFLILYLA